jgi:hypothetical protein
VLLAFQRDLLIRNIFGGFSNAKIDTDQFSKTLGAASKYLLSSMSKIFKLAGCHKLRANN